MSVKCSAPAASGSSWPWPASRPESGAALELPAAAGLAGPACSRRAGPPRARRPARQPVASPAWWPVRRAAGRPGRVSRGQRARRSPRAPTCAGGGRGDRRAHPVHAVTDSIVTAPDMTAYSSSAGGAPSMAEVSDSPVDWVAEHTQRYLETGGEDGHEMAPGRPDLAAHDDGPQERRQAPHGAHLRARQRRLRRRRLQGRLARSSPRGTSTSRRTPRSRSRSSTRCCLRSPRTDHRRGAGAVVGPHASRPGRPTTSTRPARTVRFPSSS